MSASIQGLDRLPGVGRPHVQSRLDQGFLAAALIVMPVGGARSQGFQP
ncbi:hypothetical protein [uncultured Lamprocystis sp.]|nr:hypothetical protein [uncultured Lamprocystis sp.]